MRMLWEEGSQTLRQIGEMFGGMDYAAVAQRVRRARISHTPKTVETRRRQILNTCSRIMPLCGKPKRRQHY